MSNKPRTWTVWLIERPKGYTGPVPDHLPVLCKIWCDDNGKAPPPRRGILTLDPKPKRKVK